MDLRIRAFIQRRSLRKVVKYLRISVSGTSLVVPDLTGSEGEGSQASERVEVQVTDFS